jgi:hypothetical protein
VAVPSSTASARRAATSTSCASALVTVGGEAHARVTAADQ